MPESGKRLRNAPQSTPDVPWRGEHVSRLMLGTAQLGLDYGIANTRGRPDLRAATAIVEAAWECGVRYFDTAQDYGESEAILGGALGELGIADQARVESKLAPSMDPDDRSVVEASIERTLERLGVERLWCMMLHRPSWLASWDHGLGDVLRRYRDAGRIQHVGVSVSRSRDARACVEQPDMEVLQVPCNAWDRRMQRLGVLETAADTGRLCCIRSIYLKGLLTLGPQAVAERLPAAHQASLRWQAVTERYDIPPVEMAVRYALTFGLPLVVGAESPGQVRDTARLAQLEPLTPDVVEALAEEIDPLVDEAILFPWHWENP